MPQKPPRVCAKSGCSALTTNTYCETHRDYSRRKWDERRNKELRKLYSTVRWYTTRRLIFERDPVCVKCHRMPSAICDHAIPAVKWVALGNDFFDMSNLAGMCKPCHDSKTATEDSTFAGAH